MRRGGEDGGRRNAALVVVDIVPFQFTKFMNSLWSKSQLVYK